MSFVAMTGVNCTIHSNKSKSIDNTEKKLVSSHNALWNVKVLQKICASFKCVCEMPISVYKQIKNKPLLFRITGLHQEPTSQQATEYSTSLLNLHKHTGRHSNNSATQTTYNYTVIISR